MTRLYRFSLHLLPADLRATHGFAMEQMFVREFAQARSQGWLSAATTGAAGLWDVLKRAVYERGRPARNPSGPQPTRAQLLRQLAVSFAIAFVGLTALLLFNFGTIQIPSLNARGASAETIAKFLLLSVPFTAAMTIPMAVFLSVLYVFTRLGAKETLATAWNDVRRLLVTVLAAAVGVAALACVVTADIVPRANKQLLGVLSGGAVKPTDRTMTIAQLREAARNVKPSAESDALARVASYEVEIQKKFALPAACLVLAMVGMAIAFSFPRGGTWLVVGASLVVFAAYYTMLLTGESLAERLVVSPVVGMWGTNALLLTAALLAVWRRSGLRKEAAFE